MSQSNEIVGLTLKFLDKEKILATKKIYITIDDASKRSNKLFSIYCLTKHTQFCFQFVDK
jgi:hypothetical protein